MAGWPRICGVGGGGGQGVLFVRFAASSFRRLPSVCVFGCFPFCFEDRMWDLIVSVPDHCLSSHSQKQVWCFHTLISF